MTILNIGKSSYDIVIPMEDYPTEANGYSLSERIETGGGSAANVAYLLGKWGETAYLSTVIGSDDYGARIKKELNQVMVKNDLIETSYEVGTPLTVILLNRKNGTNTTINVTGKNFPNIKKYEYSVNPNVIYSDGLEYSATINALNKYPGAISIVNANRVDRDLLELCKFVKYIICTKDFAEAVTGFNIDYDNSNTLVTVYKKLKDKYSHSEIVITLDKMGAIYTLNNEIRVMPGLNTNTIDTNGTGDIFRGAFAYCLANSFDIEKSVTYANIAAGLSVGKIGLRSSIPNLKEVINYYNERFNKIELVDAEPVQTPEKSPTEEDKNDTNIDRVGLPPIPEARSVIIPAYDPNKPEEVKTNFFGGN